MPISSFFQTIFFWIFLILAKILYLFIELSAVFMIFRPTNPLMFVFQPVSQTLSAALQFYLDPIWHGSKQLWPLAIECANELESVKQKILASPAPSSFI